jgi:hypothetical protein
MEMQRELSVMNEQYYYSASTLASPQVAAIELVYCFPRNICQKESRDVSKNLKEQSRDTALFFHYDFLVFEQVVGITKNGRNKCATTAPPKKNVQSCTL